MTLLQSELAYLAQLIKIIFRRIAAAILGTSKLRKYDFTLAR